MNARWSQPHSGRTLGHPPSARQLELAEWVEFLEKYAHFADLEAAFGGGGR